MPGKLAICLDKATARGKCSPMTLVLDEVLKGSSNLVGNSLEATTLDEVTVDPRRKKPKKKKKKRKVVEGPPM